MKQRWLRNINDGFIYGWDHYMAQHPLVEEVTEEEAFPERFLQPAQVQRAKATRVKNKVKLDLSTEDTVVEELDAILSAAPVAAAGIAEDASRGLPE